VVLDIDHFKRVNDEHGHELGDRALVWLGALLKVQARGVDVTARVGGEEFVVLLPRADLEAARAFAERVRIAVAENERGLTVSAGVASAAAPIDDQLLLAEADQALYVAKRSGRSRIVTNPRADDAGAVPANA
jgi:diguanylate cyclase (GGDEF)-like protein